MPAIVGTPESLLPRSDSKNPATTCKGLTTSGRPCRRSLASPKDGQKGVLAVLPHVGSYDSAAAYFCWQHKDQATSLIGDAGEILDLQRRSSLDTLMERLGVLEIDNNKKTRKGKQNVIKKDVLPQQWSRMSGPLLSVPEDPLVTRPSTGRPTPVPQKRVRKRNDQIRVSFFCCMKGSEEEALPPARPRQAKIPTNTSQIPHQSSFQSISNTLEGHLSFIPERLDHTTRSALMAEISKPLTVADHESGYIYMFWLTPKDVPHDAARAASSLLSYPDRTTSPRSTRRASDVLREFNNEQAKKVMLKIGRASNVHRRMVQWSQQCGHHITLLRYYPHHNSNSASGSPQVSPKVSSRSTPTLNSLGRQTTPSPLQKTPLVPRVERLIHLELANQQVKRDCEGCGKEHREWFEVAATRDGIREVDSIIRRWITWAQQQRK